MLSAAIFSPPLVPWNIPLPLLTAPYRAATPWERQATPRYEVHNHLVYP
jgi:hypothetical protein